MITITGNDIHEIRYKLGMQAGAMIAVNLSGDTASPKIKVSSDGEVRIFGSSRTAISYIARQLRKRIPRAKQKIRRGKRAC